MEFDIIFYRDLHGRSPVDEFLDDLRSRHTELYGLAERGIGKLKRRENHGEPLTKSIGDGLYELRAGRRETARVLWFFVAGARIVLVHGFMKKTNRIPEVHRAMAVSRKEDYLRRHPGARRESRYD